MSLTWLPPLNSHDQYEINVKIVQPGEAECYGSYVNSWFWMNLKVSVNFFSDNQKGNNTRSFLGLSMDVNEFPLPCHSTSFFKEMVAELHNSLIPFQLNKVKWSERHFNSNKTDDVSESCCTLSEDTDLVDKICEFLFRMREQPHNAGKNSFPFDLEIEKIVKMPDQELKAWNFWYDEKKRSDPNFEQDFLQAISRPRIEEELIYETTVEFKGVMKSSIGALEVVNLDDLNSRNSCLICLENLVTGLQAIQLPCSHIFHEDCIMRWFKQNHMCPLCRLCCPHFD
ncbi:hypothetical protein ACH5RR_009056 [Cinchona calisaya]|uniref:RING-type E3 ubiquitin transferase n=1 Tax=Cinchona calisaya TaxID=153742 RepID=A0ABD3ADH6_9GENT